MSIAVIESRAIQVSPLGTVCVLLVACAPLQSGSDEGSGGIDFGDTDTDAGSSSATSVATVSSSSTSSTTDASSDDASAGSSDDASSTHHDVSTDTSAESSTTFDFEPEICDGVDNDSNGIVDDVDEAGDGVCDCLRIATLGDAGIWGAGDVFAEWLETRSDDGAHALTNETLTEELLEDYQVIVVQNVSTIGRSYADDEVAALQAWVENGGGLMTLIGYADPSELANVNRLLAPWNVGYDDEQILQKQGGSTVPVTEWYDHPIGEGVMLVGVDNGYPVIGEGFVYATEQGYDVGHALEPGVGKVSVWVDEWITYDSEWQDHPDYQVETFWLNTIKWLTPVENCQVPLPG